jgi:hypothetical protein
MRFAIITLSLVLLCCAFVLVFPKSKKNSIYNEGIIHFRSYYVNAADTFRYDKKTILFDTGTYYVKENRILRIPYHAEPILMAEAKNSSGSQSSLYLDLSNPGYIMDLNKKLVYIFNDSASRIKKVKSLDSLYSELLHGGLIGWNTQLVKIISQDPSGLSGIALKTDTKETIVFRCSKHPWNVTSPLNYFFNGLKYPVVAMAFGKNNIDNKIDKWLVYEITAVEDKKIDEKFFHLMQ